MTLPRLMISSVLQLFPSIFKYSFVFDFEFFCLNFFYLNRLLGSSTVVFFVFCDLDWGWGREGYSHLYGLYDYVLLWGIWMGKWIQRVMHAFKLSQIPIQCQCCLIMGLFSLCPLLPVSGRGWGGGGRVGDLILPSCIPY